MMTASPDASFFRFGAAASLAAVVGIVVAQVILAPGAPEPGIGGIIRAYADPTFQAQSLTILLQVLAMFIALVVLAVKVFPVAPGLTILAGAWLVMWQVLEIVPRSIDYFTFSLDYARSYVAGAEDAAFIEGEFRRFFAWERGWRSMRQVVWAAGLLIIGLAAWRGRGLARWVGAIFMFNGVRVAALLIASIIGISLPLGRWSFVVVNLTAFGLLAIWLWTSPELERRQ
ncbi:MAG: hypothetical protein KY459_06925 [Acidobacteria bacterium]|nr:hypothetical protein [Acidobacteriota bacterium]